MTLVVMSHDHIFPAKNISGQTVKLFPQLRLIKYCSFRLKVVVSAVLVRHLFYKNVINFCLSPMLENPYPKDNTFNIKVLIFHSFTKSSNLLIKHQ